VEEALLLATETMPTLSSGFGQSVGMLALMGWFGAMADVAIFLETFSWNMIAILIVTAFLPVIVAWDIAATSSLCDTLREKLNEKRIKSKIKDAAALEGVSQLERALDRLNQSQGLGFVVFNTVVSF